MSCRLEDGSILITPSLVRKNQLSPNNLCNIDLNGKIISSNAKPSSEYRIHCAAYKARADIMAVVHAHPPFAVVCSLATISFEYPILPETALLLGSIPTVPYFPPGSEELANATGEKLTDHNALILQRHGVVAFGHDLEEAFDRLEEVEHAAKIAYYLSLKGRIPALGRRQLVNIMDFAKRQGLPVPKIASRLLYRILSK